MGVDHAALDPAVHPQGARRSAAHAPARTLYGRAACLDAPPAGRDLGIANIFACALFAADGRFFTGDLLGDRLRRYFRKMRKKKRGYSGGFAAGIIAAGGTLGILLPPSITMILYAVAAEQSLGPAVPGGDLGRRSCWSRCSRSTRCGKFRREFSAAQGAVRAQPASSPSCCARTP